MPVKLVFLGRLETIAGQPERMVEAVDTMAQLVAGLEPALAAAVSGDKVRLALNGALVTDRDGLALRDGDEIAFLPPVSGG